MQTAAQVRSLELPVAFQPLFQPKRYKIFWGGRGAAKSESFAKALLVMGASKPLRILCAREIQESIKQSVHALLKSQIEELGLEHIYEVQNTVIKGNPVDPVTGESLGETQFFFAGLKHNIDSIKSIANIDIVWVEEGQTVSNDSWDKLIPTIRSEGSEIWVSFNPELDTDATYKRFVLNPPRNAVVVKVNWSDNPWFPKVLEDERQDLQARDPDGYLNVWEGHTKSTLEGSVFAEELRAATLQNRICKVPVTKAAGVHVFVDLGYADYTSLWFMQKIGLEYHFILSYQNRLKLWPFYLEEIQKTGFLINTIWLPHDGDHENVRGKAPYKVTKEVGFNCRVVPVVPIKTRIDAAREIFPACYFDEEGCADGLQALRRYVWDKSPSGLSTREPKHDANSHFADSFQVFGVGFKEGTSTDENAATLDKKLKAARVLRLNIPMQGGGGWMG